MSGKFEVTWGTAARREKSLGLLEQGKKPEIV